MQTDLLLTEHGADEEPLDTDEREAAQGVLWRLLEKRARYFTMDDSSSLRVERAEMLLESVCYTLRTHLKLRGIPRRALLTGDPVALYDEAVATLEEAVTHARRLYELALALTPPIISIAYRDTLRGLGGFFQRYDIRTFAQDIPADIDYPLCLPVSDELLGASYVTQYLGRLLIEGQLLELATAGAVRRLLYRSCPDPVGLHVNLCEPVITNATGAALCGLRAKLLDVPGDAGRALAGRLDGLKLPELKACISTAAEAAMDELGLIQPAVRAYFAQTAQQLAPRLHAALEAGDISRVFISL